MLLAEPGGVQLDFIDGEEVAEDEVVAAALEPVELGRKGLRVRTGDDILGNVDGRFFCLAVPTDSIWQSLDTIRNPVLFLQVGVSSFRVWGWPWLHGLDPFDGLKVGREGAAEGRKSRCLGGRGWTPSSARKPLNPKERSN